MARIDATADVSFADRLALIKLGIAIDAIIRIIAITISNSISEKPFCVRCMESPFMCPQSGSEDGMHLERSLGIELARDIFLLFSFQGRHISFQGRHISFQ